MTGFGSAERNEFKVEVRSLNHRYMDISIRMPSFLFEHEVPFRNMIKERFARGKFEMTVSVTDKRPYNVRVNKQLAKAIYNAFLELQKELSVESPIGMDIFARYGDILISEEQEYSADALYEAARDALSHLDDMRRKEGGILKEEMMSRLKMLENIQTEIMLISKDIANNYKEKLSKRIAGLISDMPIDEARIAQEIVMQAQKADITEELSRLNSHIQQFSSFLSDGDAVGRRLDFILQEMNREANTIASKAEDIRIINLAVDLKTEIERLREQVQNIQ